MHRSVSDYHSGEQLSVAPEVGVVVLAHPNVEYLSNLLYHHDRYPNSTPSTTANTLDSAMIFSSHRSVIMDSHTLMEIDMAAARTPPSGMVSYHDSDLRLPATL